MPGSSICGTQGASFGTLLPKLMPSVLAMLFWNIYPTLFRESESEVKSEKVKKSDPFLVL